MTFDELNLDPEVVAALASEGIEVPTPFQSAAVPVIARGNDVLGRVGPGGGALVGYAAPILSRLEGGAGSPCCIVLCTGHRQATELARSIAPVAEARGHRAAALTDRWALPERADMLFVPPDGIARLFDGDIPLAALGAVVIHDGDGLLEAASRDRLDALYETFPAEVQRVICGQPFGRELVAFADGHTKRAVTVPPGPTDKAEAPRGKPRRTVELQVVEEGRLESALDAVIHLLDKDVRHVVVFTASEDQAADVGDFLTVHGFHAGAPGDGSVPVWLSADDEWEADTSDTLPESVATLSYAVPSGPASASKRHDRGGPALVLAEVRELGHVRELARGAGFGIDRRRPTRPTRVSTRIDELSSRLGELVGSPRLTPYYLLVEALLSRFTAAEIAAAALLQLDESGAKAAGQSARPEATPWVRLFVSAGERDQIGPRELLGAITGESSVKGDRVGRIDVRESHSLVEVRQEDARKVIDALNGTTLGGRAVRVDYDRGKDRRSTPGKGGKRAPIRR